MQINSAATGITKNPQMRRPQGKAQEAQGKDLEALKEQLKSQLQRKAQAKAEAKAPDEGVQIHASKQAHPGMSGEDALALRNAMAQKS